MGTPGVCRGIFTCRRCAAGNCEGRAAQHHADNVNSSFAGDLHVSAEQKKHDAIAATMHDLLNHFNYRDVHIFFVLLAPSLYYKEGMPLKNISWLPVDR